MLILSLICLVYPNDHPLQEAAH